MESENWDKVKEIFHAALAVEPGKRALVLNSFCDGDDELRREIEGLLASHDEADELYETPFLNIETGLKAETCLAPDERVGAYKIEREIGRGGMGTVYLAQRDDEQFKKQVAIKFIQHSSNAKEAARRFRYERQILAALEHPNIARLLDGGTNRGGLPYLVMEYVDGLPLIEFCDQKQLATKDRLRLFLKICGAVNYAHQHLVIHRDIKPANILVTESGEPKLLDFGVAKLLDTDLLGTDVTETAPAQRLFTAQYASPEQARGETVSTATDVYSLGVVLYESLTGIPPYELNNKRFEEILRIISETNPPPPSSVVSGAERRSVVGKETAKNKERRTNDEGQKTNPKFKIRNPNSLMGDLDNIILMAMRKEPARRYKSVEQFAEDVRRHLEGLPVIARQDTFAYRAEKFIKRNRIGAAAAAIVLLAILAGVAATLWQANVARTQARVAAGERDRAQSAQAKAESINRFLQKMLGSAAPEKDGRGVKVVEVLENAERQAREELAAQPEILAEALQTIGGTYLSLAQYESAERILRSALEVYQQQQPGDNQLGTARCVYALADVMMKTQRFEEAEPLLRQAIEVQRRYLPETNKELVESLAQLGASFVNRKETAQAEPFLQESLTLARNAFGEASEEMLFALHALAALYSETNNPAGEIEIYRQVIPVLQKIPSAKGDLATANLNLGMTLVTEGNLSEAEPVFVEGIRLYREIYGEDNVRVANAMVLLAQLRLRQKRYAEAQAEAEKALAMQKKYLPPGNTMFTGTWSALGVALTRQGKPREGEPFLRQSLDNVRKNVPAGHPGISLSESRLGECLAAQKRFAEAEPLLARSYDNLKTKLGESKLITVEALQRVVKLYEDSAQPEKAASYRKLLSQAQNTINAGR